MLTRLSLRLRMFLMFAAIAGASIAVVWLALYFGFTRTAETGTLSAFVVAAVVSAFGILGLSAAIWLLFDENVAKPIERLSAALRTRAHAGTSAELSPAEARYLGDLAPAVQAVTGQLAKSSAETERAVAQETALLTAEKEHLAALLTEIPVAIILVAETQKILLYDGQAATVLGQVQAPRLNASIFDYFDETDLMAAYEKLSPEQPEVLGPVKAAAGDMRFDLRLKKLSKAAGYMILVDSATLDTGPHEARPLVFDLDLPRRKSDGAFDTRRLADLCFVVFDTETTGLLPHKDEIVQIGAVRVLKGKIVPGETVNQLVDPGRSIPASSTKVHGITDAMVTGAPDPKTAVRTLHGFATDAVIVAHNAPFDMSFMIRHARPQDIVWDHPVLDTVLLSAVLFGASEKHTLDALCERFGITIPEDLRHTALGDAQATAEVLCKMLPILEQRGLDTFGAVIAETRKHGRLLQDLN